MKHYHFLYKNTKAKSCLFFLFFPFFLLAQVEINGIVKDNISTIPFATVVIESMDSDIVTGGITDENGAFAISINKGKYKLKVSFIGYKDWEKVLTIEKNITIEDILLETEVETLDKVVVSSKKKLIERKTDRLVFNVENSIAASGGDAVDALRLAPGVNVGTDAINMIGRGASRVMVEGRILQLSGEDLVNFLNSIAANDIKKIEIITNPPAKYEAAGTGGLINIVYKKGVRDFWKNTTTIAYNQNTYNYYTFRNSFLYNKNKVRLNLNLNGNLGDIREIEEYTTKYPTGPWETKSNVKVSKDNLSSRLALDYDVSEKTTLGIQYLGNFSQPNRKDKTITDILDINNELDLLYDNKGTNDINVNSHVYNLHLVSRLDTIGKKISLDIDYFNNNYRLNRSYLVNTLSSDNVFTGINQSAINKSDQDLHNFSAKLDIEYPLRLINLSYGGKVSFSETSNDLRTFNRITGAPVFDPTLSNEFEYSEKIQALYVNGVKEINEKIEVQAGLRLENTITKGVSKTLDQTNKNDYLKLFPTLYISYKKNENHNFSFNYGKRINRPSFRDLNPFRFFNNSNSYSEGNPFIQPSFSDNFDFYYTYKEVLTTNVFFNLTSDGYGTIFTADSENNIQAIIRRNYYTGYQGGIGESYSFNKLSWWESQASLYLIGYKSDFENDVEASPKNGFELYFDTYNTFKVGKTTKLQLDFFYSSPYKNGLLDFGQRYGLDFGIRQSFLKKDLQLSLYVKDIFDTGSQNNLTSEVNGVEVIYDQNYSRRYFRATLSYNFGNSKVHIRKRKFGNDEERRRAN